MSLAVKKKSISVVPKVSKILINSGPGIPLCANWWLPKTRPPKIRLGEYLELLLIWCRNLRCFLWYNSALGVVSIQCRKNMWGGPEPGKCSAILAMCRCRAKNRQVRIVISPTDEHPRNYSRTHKCPKLLFA